MRTNGTLFFKNKENHDVYKNCVHTQKEMNIKKMNKYNDTALDVALEIEKALKNNLRVLSRFYRKGDKILLVFELNDETFSVTVKKEEV
jgi:DNA-binding transcriptional regulator WhiA